jgi:hypothetical protein
MQSVDGLAFMVRTRRQANVFIVTGDSGSRMTGTIAGLLLTDLIQAAESWAGLYNRAVTFPLPVNLPGECQRDRAIADLFTGGDRLSRRSSVRTGAILRRG